MKRFIHIPKNGGMTLRHGLKGKIKISSNEDLPPEYLSNFKSTMSKYNEHGGPEHARWKDLNEDAQRDQCFAVTRNPWSRVVSRYTFLMDLLKHNKGNIRSKPQYKIISFEEFLNQRHADANIPFFWHRAIRCWYTQKDHVTDNDGKLRCDILRLENDDVNRYFNLTAPLRRRNVSETIKPNYKDFYNDKTIQIVADWYKDDVEFFGYDFDGLATKNIWNHENN